MDLVSQLLLAAVLWAPAVYGCVLGHELGHAVVARWLGVEVHVRVYANDRDDGWQIRGFGVTVTLGRSLRSGESFCGTRSDARRPHIPMSNGEELAFALGGPVADVLLLGALLAGTFLCGALTLGGVLCTVPILSLLVNLAPVDDRDGRCAIDCLRRRRAWRALPVHDVHDVT